MALVLSIFVSGDSLIHRHPDLKGSFARLDFVFVFD